MDDLLFYLGFNRVAGIGPARLDRLLAYCGSLAAAWHAPVAELIASGLDARSVKALMHTRQTLDLQAEHDRALHQGIRLISRDDPAYPALLAQTVNPPFLLWHSAQSKTGGFMGKLIQR